MEEGLLLPLADNEGQACFPLSNFHVCPIGVSMVCFYYIKTSKITMHTHTHMRLLIKDLHHQNLIDENVQKTFKNKNPHCTIYIYLQCAMYRITVISTIIQHALYLSM